MRITRVVPPVTANISSCAPTATPTSVFVPGSSVPSGQAASTSSSGSGAPSTMPTSMKYEIGIGIGVGVPVVVGLVMIAIICTRMFRLRRKPRKATAYDLNKYYGVSAENLRDHASFDDVRTVPTTIYANRASPMHSNLHNKPIPLSPPVMEVPLVFSRDARRVMEPHSPLHTPPAFEAFHPSKCLNPVTATARASLPISEQAYPVSLQRPGSGSSYYSEEGPYEMGP